MIKNSASCTVFLDVMFKAYLKGWFTRGQICHQDLLSCKVIKLVDHKKIWPDFFRQECNV